ncbi:sulfotransferase family protein [Micromonospora sp. NPDC023956]|uniref:sulfotransferase family protein n=1 Tax=Micromonospora sp. NPDC023956 TaxID=3155722 RepID=UPI0033EDC27D
MDVIGVGFGRTGTLSLRAALVQLGFDPCYHFATLFEQPDQAKYWLAAAENDVNALRTALDGYRATVDWPGTAFWRELVREYPNAKVILSTRDSAAWYDSMEKTILRLLLRGEQSAAVAAQFPGQPPEQLVQTATLVGHRVVVPRCFDGRVDDRDHVIACYERHNEAVRREVPADRLLEYRVGEGWDPICRFLGVEVPDSPYPHLNERPADRGGPVR